MGVGPPVIRGAVDSDVDDLADLIEQLGYPDTSPVQIAERIALLRAAGGEILVAEIEGRVVGCLTTSMMQVLHRPRPVGRISMFVVAQELRGTGIGKRLLEEAQRHLRARGCQLLEVTSNLKREEAHAFYRHLGWEQTSLRFSRDDWPK